MFQRESTRLRRLSGLVHPLTLARHVTSPVQGRARTSTLNPFNFNFNFNFNVNVNVNVVFDFAFDFAHPKSPSVSTAAAIPRQAKMPPPLPSQKGTGKKGRDRHSRSRNSTPNLPFLHPDAGGVTALLELPVANFQTDDEILENSGGSISSSKELEALLERLNKLVAIVETRGSVCDRGMRAASELRKDRLQEIESERRDEERKERAKKDAAEEEERGRNKATKMKKRKDASAAREERPLSHGAHGLAPQDGSHKGELHLSCLCRLCAVVVCSVLHLASCGRWRFGRLAPFLLSIGLSPTTHRASLLCCYYQKTSY